MDNSVRIGAAMGAALLLACFLYLVLSGGDRSAYLSVAAVLVFAVLATRLDDIKNLKFGTTGVSAELERQLREAQATVRQLQNTAEVFAKISILQISSSDRLGGLNPKEKREAITMIADGLKAIDLPDNRIASTLAVQIPFDDYDYYHWALEWVLHSSDTKAVEARKELKQQFPNSRIGNNPTPAEIETYLNSRGWNRGKVTERLVDWNEYRRTGRHRRLDQWDQRHKRRLRFPDFTIE